MLRLGPALRALAGSTTGASAVEFALLAPFFICLFLTGTDALRYIQARDQVTLVASTVGELISQNDSGSVTYVDLQFFQDSAILSFPRLLPDSANQGRKWASIISVSMAQVDFGPQQTNCNGSCQYVPKMVWSGGAVPRSCVNPMVAADDASDPTPSTLPSHLYGPGSVIVVDVVYPFKPLFQSALFSGLTVKRSHYIAPRFVSTIKYGTIKGDNGIAKACPGYS